MGGPYEIEYIYFDEQVEYNFFEEKVEYILLAYKNPLFIFYLQLSN